MNKQQGVTLIIVLVLVLLITVVGTLAIRASIVGLKVATNSQIQALLLENSDAALFNIEDPRMVVRQLAQDGMFSYFNAAENSEDELVFCYRAAAADFFRLDQASVISPNGMTTKIGESGFCKANQFATGRPAILAQVYLTKNMEASAPLSQLNQGTSLGQSLLPIVSHQIGVTVISVLPGFSNISSTQLEDCFKQRASQVSQCFNQYNVPYNTQHADYVVGGQLNQSD